MNTLYQYYQQHPTVFIDTRKKVVGGIFVAVGQKDERGCHRGNQFAAQALAGLFQSRTSSRGIIKEMGWDKEEVKAHLAGSQVQSQAAQDFMTALMGRILPNLKRIGVLTPEVKAVFDGMGFDEYENFDSDGDIDWEELSAPLDYKQHVA